MSIVVGVDNGPGGQLAIRWAVAEALLRGRALRVVHVSTDSDGDPLEPVHARLPVAAPGLRGYLDAMAYARDRLPDGMLSGIHPPGRPIIVLVEESAKSEMLVVGSRGRSPVRTVLSSVSSAVAAHATPATVVVRASEDEPVERRHIVVGVDGSWHADKALEFALAEARLRHTDLVVVWGRAHGNGTPRTADELMAGRTVQEPAVHVHEEWTDREPADALIDHTHRAELTVVGSRGHSGVAGVVLGSVSQAVLRHAHGPVAVVH